MGGDVEYVYVWIFSVLVVAAVSVIVADNGSLTSLGKFSIQNCKREKALGTTNKILK